MYTVFGALRTHCGASSANAPSKKWPTLTSQEERAYVSNMTRVMGAVIYLHTEQVTSHSDERRSFLRAVRRSPHDEPGARLARGSLPRTLSPCQRRLALVLSVVCTRLICRAPPQAYRRRYCAAHMQLCALSRWPGARYYFATTK